MNYQHYSNDLQIQELCFLGKYMVPMLRTIFDKLYAPYWWKYLVDAELGNSERTSRVHKMKMYFVPLPYITYCDLILNQETTYLDKGKIEITHEYKYFGIHFYSNGYFEPISKNQRIAITKASVGHLKGNKE